MKILKNDLEDFVRDFTLIKEELEEQITHIEHVIDIVKNEPTFDGLKNAYNYYAMTNYNEHVLEILENIIGHMENEE